MFKEIERLEKSLLDPSKLEDITPADYFDWSIHPLTQALHNDVKAYLLQQAQMLLENTPADELARMNEALIRGECQGLRWVLEWKPEIDGLDGE